MSRQLVLCEDDVEYMLKQAVDHYTASQTVQAERLLRGILAVDPEEWRAWQLLGSVLALEGYTVAASAMYKQCLKIKPDDMYALAALAEMSLAALRTADAGAYVERLVALDPDGRHPAANRVRRILAESIARMQDS